MLTSVSASSRHASPADQGRAAVAFPGPRRAWSSPTLAESAWTVSSTATDGEQVLFLSESGMLASEPDSYAPGWSHTAVGGSAREWSTELPAKLTPGGAFAMRLVMTNIDADEPPLEIAYELRVEPQS